MKQRPTIPAFPTRSWPVRIGLILVVLALAVSLMVVFLPYTVDDAFITFRYAKNLSEGLGPVFNPGERVEGYTTFLWMLLMSAGLSGGIDAVLLSKLLGLACALGTIAVTAILAHRVSDRPQRVAVLAGLLLAANVDVALNSVAGLETPLFMLLITAAVARQVREEQEAGRPLAPLLFGLAALTRPEGLAYAGASLLYLAITHRRELGRILLRWVPFGVLVAAHFAWRYSYYGDWLPNTFYAKSVPLVPRVAIGVTFYVGDFLQDYGFLFLVAWFFALRQGNRRLRYPLFMTAAGIAIVALTGGDWMERNRFLLPIIPLMCLITAEVVSRIHDQLVQRSRGLAEGVTAAVLILYLGLNARGLASLYHYTTVRAAGYESAHMQLARWLDESLPPGSSVALMDVGIVGYYTDLRVLDITGLTDRTIAHSPGVFFNKEYDARYILDQEPEVIALVDWDKDLEPDLFIDEGIYSHPDFLHRYTFDHKLEHYNDPQLGYYYLLVYRRRS
jgi:arabinofuranosyltransferase